jgi:pimeloyl-ACP methyl ester carboxylesterase
VTTIPESPRRGTIPPWKLVWVLGFVLGMASEGTSRRIVGAATLLTELGTKGAQRANLDTSELVVEEGALRFRARLYVPRGPTHRCAVIGHGVQWKGIDEPRLAAFASRLGARGVVVLTPELVDLIDYRITRRGADVLSAAVRHLSRLCGGDRVGLLGFSFGGGLSLLAATNPGTSDHLAYVASVGGYHDLSRVLTFLLTDRVVTPRGVVVRKAHEYGVIILVYEHLESFVPEEDLPVMHPAVQAWLREDRAGAWALASRRTTERGERLFMNLVRGRLGEFRDQLASILSSESAEERALSPKGTLGEIPVPVYLLHGEGDTVIPSDETVWAGLELGSKPHRALVSPLIEHVEISGEPSLGDRWALVRFMAALL